MKLYKKIPSMLKWKKFFLYFGIVLGIIITLIKHPVMLVIFLLALLMISWIMVTGVLAEAIYGDKRNVNFIFKFNWHHFCLDDRFVDIVAIHNWCVDNIKGKWERSDRNFLFKNSNDAMAFKLRWL